MTRPTLPKIAAVDAGGTTGLAIASIRIDWQMVTLKCKVLTSISEPGDVVETIGSNGCAYVVMESMASQGSKAGTRPYMEIEAGLKSWDYVVTPGYYLFSKCLLSVSPGVWKPFMKATSVDKGKWSPADSHQSDAMQLLYFAVKVNYLNRKVRYG